MAAIFRSGESACKKTKCDVCIYVLVLNKTAYVNFLVSLCSVGEHSPTFWWDCVFCGWGQSYVLVRLWVLWLRGNLTFWWDCEFCGWGAILRFTCVVMRSSLPNPTSHFTFMVSVWLHIKGREGGGWWVGRYHCCQSWLSSLLDKRKRFQRRNSRPHDRRQYKHANQSQYLEWQDDQIQSTSSDKWYSDLWTPLQNSCAASEIISDSEIHSPWKQTCWTNWFHLEMPPQLDNGNSRSVQIALSLRHIHARMHACTLTI